MPERAIDGNGHVPDDDGHQAASIYRDGYTAGYNQALIDLVMKVGSQIRADVHEFVSQVAEMAKS